MAFCGHPSTIIIYRNYSRPPSVVSRIMSGMLRPLDNWGHQTLYKCPTCSAILPPSMAKKGKSGEITRYRYECARCYWYPQPLWLLPPPGSFHSLHVERDGTIKQDETASSRPFYFLPYTRFSGGKKAATRTSKDDDGSDYVAKCFQKWLKHQEHGFPPNSKVWAQWLTTGRGKEHLRAIAAIKEGRVVPKGRMVVWKPEDDQFWRERSNVLSASTKGQKKGGKA